MSMRLLLMSSAAPNVFGRTRSAPLAIKSLSPVGSESPTTINGACEIRRKIRTNWETGTGLPSTDRMIREGSNVVTLTIPATESDT